MAYACIILVIAFFQHCIAEDPRYPLSCNPCGGTCLSCASVKESCSVDCENAVNQARGDIQEAEQDAARANNIADRQANQAVADAEEEASQVVCNSFETVFNHTLNHLFNAFEIANGSIDEFEELIFDDLWLYFIQKEKECIDTRIPYDIKTNNPWIIIGSIIGAICCIWCSCSAVCKIIGDKSKKETGYRTLKKLQWLTFCQNETLSQTAF